MTRRDLIAHETWLAATCRREAKSRRSKSSLPADELERRAQFILGPGWEDAGWAIGWLGGRCMTDHNLCQPIKPDWRTVVVPPQKKEQTDGRPSSH